MADQDRSRWWCSGRVLAGLAAIALAGCSPQQGPADTISWRAPAGTPLVRIGAARAARPIPPGFLGLSIEYTAAVGYAGPNGRDPVFLRLIRNLDPGQSPVLRFGGDSGDWAWVAVPGMAKPAGVRLTITPATLRSLAGLTHALDARAILGLDLEADSTAIVAAEGRAFRRSLGGPSIAALELGNEPELYGRLGWYTGPNGAPVLGRARSYDIAGYAADAVRFARVLPRLPLAGPATGSARWMDALGKLLRSGPRLGMVTVHRYPLDHCDRTPGTPEYPTLANLLSPASSTGLARSVAGVVRVAHAHGAQLRVDELNSASCRGQPGISNTFASALWALDTLFAMARVGVDGVNVHTLPDSLYHPFAVSGSGSARRWTVQPVYYGLLMFADAVPAGSRLLSVTGKLARQVRIWAARAPGGQRRVVLINEYSRRTQYVRVAVQGARGDAALMWLRAPTLTATQGVTLGGQTFGRRTSTGLLTGRRQVLEVAPAGGTYVVRLPPASAALLTLAVPQPAAGG
jgi:hypothetical protein